MDISRKLDADEARGYSPLALAFLGDGVYERLVRRELLLRANMPAAKLHEKAVTLVCAVYQAKAARFLCGGVFTSEEEYIFRRGRNANGINAPKSAKNSDYRAATGLEAVFGYLELIGSYDRCAELFTIILENVQT